MSDLHGIVLRDSVATRRVLVPLRTTVCWSRGTRVVGSSHAFRSMTHSDAAAVVWMRRLRVVS